ncbi:MAG: hypothetical protein ACXWUM_08065 [Burkholderiaceae bacterium]
MNKGQREERRVFDLNFIHAPADVSTGIGCFYIALGDCLYGRARCAATAEADVIINPQSWF